MKIKPCRLSKQLDSVTENPFVFCGYKVSHVIGQNTYSRNIFSVHGFLNLSVKSRQLERDSFLFGASGQTTLFSDLTSLEIV